MNKHNTYLSLLKKELKTAMGCTEPAAAALTGALARDLLGAEPDSVAILASRDIIKNVMGVGIPNSSLTGTDTSVLLGVLFGDSSMGLNILSTLPENTADKILSFKEAHPVSLELAADVPPVYISATLTSGEESARITIAGEHDMVVEKVKNGEILLKQDINGLDADEEGVYPESWTVQDILAFVDNLTENEGSFLLNVSETNMAIAEHSIGESYGLSVGKTMNTTDSSNITTLEEAFQYGAVLASAASDARMSGCPLPVVINSGSGNQGITATVPVQVMADFLKSDKTATIKALALSHMVALYLTYHKGRLSALCGAFTAAIGTACAYVYLITGSLDRVENTINIMFANLMGVICDGAKKTCALKIYSCVESAAMSAKLAISDKTVGSESGIIGDKSEDTIEYARQISHNGMEQTDKSILAVMLNKPPRLRQ